MGILYTFVALAVVCDDYFVPALEVLTEKLALSEDVAGATFMAAGGSAPELFTSVLGEFVARSNVGFGTIIGSAVFNVMFVIGACSIATAPLYPDGLPLTWWPLFRDSFFYSVDLGLLTWFYSDQDIQWYESMTLLFMYLAYVLFMWKSHIVQEFVERKVGSPKRRQSASFKPTSVELESMLRDGGSTYQSPTQTYADPYPSPPSSPPPPLYIQKFVPTSPRGVSSPMASPVRPSSRNGSLQQYAFPEGAQGGLGARGGLNGGQSVFGSPTFKSAASPLSPNGRTSIAGEYEGARRPSYPISLLPGQEADIAAYCSDGGAHGKRSPFGSPDAGRNTRRASREPPAATELLLPPADDTLCQVHNNLPDPETGSLDNPPDETELSLWSPIEFPTAADGCVARLKYVAVYPINFALWLTVPNCGRDEKKHLFAVAFVFSILWIAVFSYLMVWWAEVLGRALDIPVVVMGYTLLAAGTSVPDLITSILVARKGFGDMAVSSSIGSNIFDITFGLPLPWMLRACSNGFKAIHVESDSLLPSVAMLFIMLLAVIGSIKFFGWRLNRKLGAICFLFYIIFVTMSLLLEYDVIIL
eukprot:gene2807-4386_t